MSEIPLRRRSRAVTVVTLVAALVAAVLIAPLFTTPASADTSAPGLATTATTSTQINVAPNTAPGLTGLVDGQSVSIQVNASSPPAGNAIFGVDARICKPGLNITLDAQFDPSSFPNCTAAPLSATSNDFVSVATAPPNTQANLVFKVGTGTNAATGVTCGAANPCSLWLRLSVPTTTLATGLAFVHYDLSFAGPPGVPTALTPTPGNGQMGLTWTAPASNGGAPIDFYTITGTFPGSPINTPTNATNFTVPGLTNFTSYQFNVAAHNSSGFTGGAAGPVTAAPAPPPPTGVTASPGNAQATVTWTPPALGGPPTNYTVTSAPGGFTCTTATTSCAVLGLANGTPYTFTVVANYPGGSGQPSAPSNQVTPNAKLVTQTIQAQRPPGSLDIAEACATGGVLQFGTYPQGPCLVNLGVGVLNAAGTYYVTPAGAIQTVSVQDTRDTDVGWNANAQLTNFVGTNPANTFPGGCLGFAPVATGLSNNPPVYTQTVTAGAAVPSNCAAAGLTASTVVMSAPALQGLGRADLNGALNLNIPVSAPADTYSATLTFTVI